METEGSMSGDECARMRLARRVGFIVGGALGVRELGGDGGRLRLEANEGEADGLDSTLAAREMSWSEGAETSAGVVAIDEGGVRRLRFFRRDGLSGSEAEWLISAVDMTTQLASGKEATAGKAGSGSGDEKRLSSVVTSGGDGRRRWRRRKETIQAGDLSGAVKILKLFFAYDIISVIRETSLPPFDTDHKFSSDGLLCRRRRVILSFSRVNLISLQSSPRLKCEQF